MSSAWRDAAQTLVADLRRVFSDRLLSVVAYGPPLEHSGGADVALTCLVLVRSLDIEDLDACSRMTARWERQDVAIPLILPASEFTRSLDAFPLEYSEIARAHERVFGTDPFDEVSISREDLRRACETQIKSHLVHLREGFIQAAGRPHEIATLVAASAPAFAALLRNVAWLTGVDADNRTEATRAGARVAGLSERVVGDVLALEHPAHVPTADPARLFPAYLSAVEQLARTVDTWRV